MAEVVRTAIGDVRLRTHRSLDERLFVRWPRLWPVFAQAVLLLPPRSRLRRAMLRRAVRSGWSAWVRGDLDLMLVRYAPDCRSEQPPEMVSLGLSSSYRGHAGMREWAADLREAFEVYDITPHEIVDTGDRFVVLGHAHIRGRASGVELNFQLGQVGWLQRGLAVRERQFLDWDEALRAAAITTPAGAGRAGEQVEGAPR